MSEPDSTPEDVVVTAGLRREERGVVLTVGGEVDMVSLDQFRTALDEALLDRPGPLVVDLGNLSFLGSVGLSLLLEANLAAGPGVIRVVAHDGPRRAIRITGLDKVLTVVDTVDQAFDVG